MLKLKMTRKGENIESVSYAVGAVVGLVLVGTAALLLSAWVVQWILSACGIYKATYTQVVGVLAIWEIIKPRTETK